MKFYYPTTTLNFDSILSSQMISPHVFYEPETLWWNRHELIAGERADALVFYTKCPKWDIHDPERDNYPLVLEFDIVDSRKKDSPFNEEKRVRVSDNPEVEAVFIQNSVTFKGEDLLTGKVRFLFRNEAEKKCMLIRVRTGVGECKIINPLLKERPSLFGCIQKSGGFALDKNVLGVVHEHVLQETNATYSKEEIKEERIRGAELGYCVAKGLHALRGGFYMDGFRTSIPSSIWYKNWKESLLPKPFSAVIDRLCERSLSPWDPNRSAIIVFVETCWAECFKGKKYNGKKVMKGSELCRALLSILASWNDPTKHYSVLEEDDPYVQAFAAFLECGEEAGKYAVFIESQRVKSPEYLLTLYGALVGYTSFSRTLLEWDTSLPVLEEKENSPIPLPEEKNSSKPRRNEEPKPMDYEQGDLFDKQKDVPKSLLLCDDKELGDALRVEFEKEFGEKKIKELVMMSLAEFCEKYQPGGFYYERSGDYKRTNPHLIDHWLNCMRSQSKQLKALNVSLDDNQEKQLQTFLEKRYECKRNSHGGTHGKAKSFYTRNIVGK